MSKVDSAGSGLAIIGWAVTSPYGIGRLVFSEGLAAGRFTERAIEQGQGPAETACLVPDFDSRAVLGKKGTRMMNRVTGMAVSTIGDLLRELRSDRLDPDTTGLVVGTTVGSAQSTIDFTRGSLTGERPFHVEPGLIPYAVMNGAAGQCAIWHGVKGPNATLAAGRSAGLLALNYARRLLLTGRAGTVLCGAAEEYSVARAWIAERSAGNDAPGAVLGEGCAMFALTVEPTDEPPLATLLAVKAMTCSDGDWYATVRRCTELAMAAAGVQPSDVWMASPSGAVGAAGQAERAALGDLFEVGDRLVSITELIGETHAASGALQLAAVLSLAEQNPESAQRLAVVTSTDESGTVVVCLVRLS
ncbi:beta-ketoacyl synthase N-terminal-like domain-containing protein [Streptomyces sp. NPDC048479]|uniref:beta-ketoacyl synthase N-terminal-like domain-containing protein n=1 Tax=Streptomyces sp. NPDC048479 TaxID=3154725 RepID=UPI003434C7DA